MNDAHLPPTGEVEVVSQADAAHLVEDIAHDTETTALPGPKLLIVLDIDGTVILEDQTLSPGVVDAIEHAHRAGHEVMLATGRSWEGTEHIAQKLGVSPEFVVCSNGAVIMRRVGQGDREADAPRAGERARYERFHTETFDPAEVLDLLRGHLPSARYLVELADGSRLYTEFMDDWNLTHARLVTFDELAAQPVCRVVVIAPDQEEADFLDLVSRIGLSQVSYSVGWTAWLDIAPRGVDKGTALEYVRTWRGVAPEDVLVMGDGRNDVEMFRWARENGGRAVAMAQGPKEVLDAAGESTTSVQEGGVAAVLRRL